MDKSPRRQILHWDQTRPGGGSASVHEDVAEVADGDGRKEKPALRRLATAANRIGPGLVTAVLVAVGLAGMVSLGLNNYLLFHGLVESLSVVVAVAVALLAWNARHYLQDNRFLLIIAASLLYVGLVDLLHMFAYEGMGVFPEATANLPTQLWIAARYLASVGLLVSVLLAGRAVNMPLVLGIGAAVTALLLLSIFAWDVFPACFIPVDGGRGVMTPFKIVSEYINGGILATAGVALLLRRRWFERRLRYLLLAVIALSILSGLAFTLYRDVAGVLNMVGHLFKLAAYYLLYKALITYGLTRPYDLLFREMRLRGEAELAAAHQALGSRTRQLQAMNQQLSQAEETERRRLAQLLHDHLQQLLVAVQARLRMIQQLPTARLVRDRSVEEAQDLVQEAVEASRSLAAELAPPMLNEVGLVPALEWLAEKMEKDHGLRVEVAADPEAEPADEQVRTFLYHAVRELLFNIVKHAGTQRAHLTLVRIPGQCLRLVIEDEGRGFDVSRLGGAEGFGLFSIRERLALLRGKMEIESRPGEGTTITMLAALD